MQEKHTGATDSKREGGTHKHGLVLCVSDGSFHHADHVLMGNHFLRGET